MDINKLDKGSQEFFSELVEHVKPFMSHHKMPGANWEGCSFIQGDGKDSGKIRFGFMVKGGNVISIDIVAKDILADPKEYIGNMLECIYQGLEQMKLQVNIIVPGPRSVLQKSISQAITETVH